MSGCWWTLTHPRQARALRELDVRVTALEARLGHLEPLRLAVLDALAAGMTTEQITAVIARVVEAHR